jgi:hypothetical protein
MREILTGIASGSEKAIVGERWPGAIEKALLGSAVIVVKLLAAYLSFCWGLPVEIAQFHTRTNP